MGQKKLLPLLQSLSAGEARHFRRHLRRVAGGRTQALKALDYLLRHQARLSDDEVVAHERVGRHVFDDGGIDGKRLSNLYSELYGELKTFLIGEHLKTNPRLEGRLLLEILRERRRKDLFSRTIDDELAAAERAASVADMWSHLGRLELHYLRYFVPDQTVRGNDDLLAALEHLDAFHRLTFLKIACELVNRRNIFGEPLPDGIAETAEQLAAEPAAGPAGRAFRQVFELLHNGRPDQFFALRDEFLAGYGRLSPEDRQAVLRYLINFASRRMRGGDLSFLPETFHLLRFGLDSDLLPAYDDISANVFLNTLELALSLRQFDWADGFTARFLPNVRPRERDIAGQLAGVYRLYYRGRRGEARQALATVTPVDAFTRIRVKVLLIQLFYDDGEDDLLIPALDAFRQALRREARLGEDITGAYANFARLVRLMMKHRNGRKEPVKQILESTSPIIYKKWLSDRCDG